MIFKNNKKLIHGMVFFIKNTKYCYKLKLFKLLYFLDFDHYKQTGRSVTRLKYFAWAMGPVPVALHNEINNPAELSGFFSFVSKAHFDSDFKGDKAVRLSPKIQFDQSVFSKRELHILNHLSDIYKEAKAQDMTAVSHARKSPWHQVFKEKNKPNTVIPYQYALDSSPNSISIEEADEITKDNQEMQLMFQPPNSV